MNKARKARHPNGRKAPHSAMKIFSKGGYIITGFVLLIVAVLVMMKMHEPTLPSPQASAHIDTKITNTSEEDKPHLKWLQRALAIDRLFHDVYTPCWEGANGAIGDAYLFAATHDSALLRFHAVEHDLTRMCTGAWVDDRAWVCLAELYWWNFTGRNNIQWVVDAMRRYSEARNEGRLSNHEGYWSWYNWPPHSDVNEKIFTNSNMNQMVSVACRLFEVSRDKRFLDDALLVWNGDAKYPGIEKMLYKGNGKWEGRTGPAAYGKQIPWEGTEYCSIGAALYRVTRDSKFGTIAVATAKRIMDPGIGWVDPVDFIKSTWMATELLSTICWMRMRLRRMNFGIFPKSWKGCWSTSGQTVTARQR